MTIFNKEKILETHSMKTLRKMCDKWFCTNIWYYYNDIEVDIDFDNAVNPVCEMLNSNKTGNKMCKKTYQANLKSLQADKKEISFKCFAGFYVTVVPMFDNEEYLGAVIASGMWLTPYGRNTKPYIEKLSNKGFCKNDVRLNYKKLRPIKNYNLEYLHGLLKIVSDDMVDLHNTLSEKEKIIKMQSVLIEKAYNKSYKAIVSTSMEMKKILDTLDLIKNSEVPVFIDGESGTGKELLAAAVHYNSPRRDKMFIAQSCSVFTSTILSSELFGHKKGAFTGAISDKKGLFEIVNGGTLFLDEIGDMEMESQAKLLRVLETGTFYSTGSTEQKKVDVRIITATNKDLNNQVKKGLFREDLLFRINLMHITLPPLRERGDDVILLTNYFMENFLSTQNKTTKKISMELFKILYDYRWPGNIRELKNVVERMIIISGKDDILKPEHLPKNILDCTHSAIRHNNLWKTESNFRSAVKSFEKSMLEEALKNAKGDKKKTAKTLEISLTTLYDKVQKYEIET